MFHKKKLEFRLNDLRAQQHHGCLAPLECGTLRMHEYDIKDVVSGLSMTGNPIRIQDTREIPMEYL
jgi:hypothetical protein